MSSPNPRVRGATSQRTRIVTTMAAMVIPTLVLAACSDTSLPVTAPPKAVSAEPTSFAPGEQPPNVLAGLVFCDVALIAPSGNYRLKHVPIKVSPGLFDPQGKTVKVGFRGWTRGASEPGSAALCRIPATAAATDFFKELFSVDSVATPRMPYRAAAQSVAPPPTASVVGDPITLFEGQSLECDMQILPDESCSGEEQPPDEGPPPPQEEPSDIWMGEDAGYVPPFDDGTGGYYVSALSCWGRTDLPHRSGTAGYFGNVNVHASTFCYNGSTLLTVGTILQKQKCVLWFFCSWYPVALPGFNTRFGYEVRTNSASSGCSRGYYKGSSHHSAVFPNGIGTARTANYNYIYC